MKKAFIQLLATLAIGLFSIPDAAAQATLSVQGTIQRSTGAAVDDGQYDVTFKLYTTDAGGTAVWSETQSSIEIIGGVYSVALGSVNPLTVPFDQTYYLGISVNSGAEHTPRTQLTASPYALSLLGQDNKFPSTGNVGIGTTTPGATLTVNGSIATGQAATAATSYSVAADDHVIFLDHAANQDITLPAATAANAGRHLVLVNKEAVAKTLTASDYVNLAGATSTTVPATGVVELQSDGSVWRQTGGYVQPVAAVTKAYVYCRGGGTSLPSTTTTTLGWTEVSDNTNSFSSSTFTAPRTGFYDVSGTVSTTGTTLGGGVMYVICGGTCAMGGAAQNLGNATITSNILPMVNFAGTVFMNAGETLFLRIYHNHTSTLTVWTPNHYSLLTIMEQ